MRNIIVGTAGHIDHGTVEAEDFLKTHSATFRRGACMSRSREVG